MSYSPKVTRPAPAELKIKPGDLVERWFPRRLFGGEELTVKRVVRFSLGPCPMVQLVLQDERGEVFCWEGDELQALCVRPLQCGDHE